MRHTWRQTWPDLGVDLAAKPPFGHINIQQTPLPSTLSRCVLARLWWAERGTRRTWGWAPSSRSLLLQLVLAWLPWQKLSGLLAYGVTSIWALKAGDCFCGADVGGCRRGTADSAEQLGTVCVTHIQAKWPTACSCQTRTENQVCSPLSISQLGLWGVSAGDQRVAQTFSDINRFLIRGRLSMKKSVTITVITVILLGC